MLGYIAKRLIILIPMFFLLSLISFFIVQLPPGSYLETYIRNMERRGQQVDEAEVTRLKKDGGWMIPGIFSITSGWKTSSCEEIGGGP